jgi:hypothetical protein
MRVKEEKYHIDKSFINDSWKNMKLSLDSHLPVPPKEINKTIVALLTMLFISLGFISYLLYLQLSEVPVAQSVIEKIKYEKIYINNNGYEYTQTSIPELDSKSFQKELFNDSKSQSILGENHSIEAFNILNAPLSKDQNNSSSVNDENLDVFQILQLPSIQQNSVQSHSLEKEKLENGLSDSKEIQQFEGKSFKIKYNIGLLSFISNKMDYTGYGLTSGITIPLSQKFGLTTGLAVNFISRDYFLFPFLDKRNENILKANTHVDLNDEDTYYSGLTGFNQVIIPFGFNYLLNKSFSINSGIKFRYTYGEEIDKILKSKAQQHIQKSQSVENTFFNNANVGLNAGFSYIVSNKLSFNLDSEWGLNSLINKTHFSNPNAKKYDLNLINFTTNYTF